MSKKDRNKSNKPSTKPGQQQQQQQREKAPPVLMEMSPELFQQMPDILDAAIRQLGAKAAMTVAGFQVSWNAAAQKYNEEQQRKRFTLDEDVKKVTDKLNKKSDPDEDGDNDNEDGETGDGKEA